jgi:Delta7-sterol 5-desaturase
MLTSLLGVGDDPVMTFVVLTLSGYGFYLVLASLNYLYFFVWRKERYTPDYTPDWQENRRAMRLALLSMGGNALLTAPIHVAIASGYSRVYYDVDDYGWGHLVLTVVAMLIITETLVYWAHRFLHMGRMWDHLHRHHHSFRRPTPWVAVSFHPLDSFLQAIPHHLCAFIMPVHVGVYMTSLVLVTLWSVSIHDRVTFVRWGAINYADHHAIHHWYDNYNFGQYTTFWDRLCGTYRSPKKGRGYWPPNDLA